MKILITDYYYHRSKNKIKEDILDIGRVLEIFEDDFVIAKDNSILRTWTKCYNNNEVICDINDIAQVLRVTKNKYGFPWRKA